MATSKKKGKANPKAGGIHTEREDNPWEIDIPDHPKRMDSPQYIKARKMMNAIVKSCQPWYLGLAPYQDHHGGGLWVKDEQGWFLIKNLAGMEWSSQFCADPAKVDHLRQNAKRIYDKFPLSAIAFKEVGFDLDGLLNKPINDAEGVADWTDSICNASLPLPAGRHTSVLPKVAGPNAVNVHPEIHGGVHHYPTPITDIELFKRDDFQLWVIDAEGQPTAVLPVGPRGSGISTVEVAYATPGTKLHKKLIAAHKSENSLTMQGSNPLAKQAFAKQNADDKVATMSASESKGGKRK